MDADRDDVDMIGDDKQQEVKVTSQLRFKAAWSTPSYTSGSISQGSSAVVEPSSYILFQPYNSRRAASTSSLSLEINIMLESVTDSPSTTHMVSIQIV